MTLWQARFHTWQTATREAHARAERVTRMIVDRARREAQAAGLDPTMPFLHAHNATIGARWPGVDYRRARRVLWLERRSYEPHRLASAYAARTMPQAWD